MLFLDDKPIVIEYDKVAAVHAPVSISDEEKKD